MTHAIIKEEISIRENDKTIDTGYKPAPAGDQQFQKKYL